MAIEKRTQKAAAAVMADIRRGAQDHSSPVEDAREDTAGEEDTQNEETHKETGQPRSERLDLQPQG